MRIVESDDDSQARAIENLTWAELAELSDQISVCESQEAAFELAAQFGLCSEDGTVNGSQFKLVELSNGTTAIAQIVGIYHDDKTGGGKAGLSFLLKNSFTERALVDDWRDNSGWETCSMRSWLNGDVFAMLPSDLQQAIVPVDKMANNSGGGYASASAVGIVSDRLWLPSSIELFGVNQNDNSGAINSEGYQYELYSSSGLNWSGGNIVNKNLNGKDSYGTISGVQNIWWTRTPSPTTECYWIRIQNGTPVTDYGSLEEGVAFGFCLGANNPEDSGSNPQLSQAAFVQDNYGVLTSDEAASFEQQAQSIVEQYQIGVYLVTVADIGNQSARNFAIDYYMQNDLGVGPMRSGIMLLVAVESRDFAIITHGDGNGNSEIGKAGAVDAFTDKRLDSIENNLAVYLKSDNWVKAAESFFDDSQETIEYLFVVGKPI